MYVSFERLSHTDSAYDSPSNSLNPVSTPLYHLPFSSNSSRTPLSPSSFLLRASLAAATVPAFCASSGLSSLSSNSNSLVFRGKAFCSILSCWFSWLSSDCLDESRPSVAGMGRDNSGLAEGVVCWAWRLTSVSCREEISAGKVESCVV